MTTARTHFRPIAERTLLTLAFALAILEGYDLASLGVTLPTLLQEPGLGLTTALGGIAGAVTAFGMLIGAALSGAFTHRVGPRWLIIASSILVPLGMIVNTLAPTAGVFIGGRAIVGIGLGIVLPTLLAFVAELSHAGRRARNVGIVMAGMALGGLCAPLLASVLLPGQSYRWIYLAGVIPAVIAIPFVIRLFPESPVHLVRTGRGALAEELTAGMRIPMPAIDAGDKPGALGLRVLFRPGLRAVTILFWLTVACALLLVFGITAWLPTIMQAQGFALNSALLLTAVVATGAGVGMVIGGRVADAVGPKRVTVTAFIAGAVCLALIAQKPDLWVLLILLFLCGFGLMGSQAFVNAFIVTRYPADLRANGLSWALAAGRPGAMLGPVLGAAVLGSSLPVQWNFYAFAIVAVLGAVLALFVPVSVRLSAPNSQPAAAAATETVAGEPQPTAG
ncbi:MFS transporter [Leifsonia sp. Leaf264]|uniref:MFS transporter n=1 Tax=Leifsonia sp. Leaf264 TaxID=1736314 RepID=UPI0009E6A72E|nr:MFS transporter [Leifsonia sp. Leaf264]